MTLRRPIYTCLRVRRRFRAMNHLARALPFWVSLLIPGVAVIAATQGGWAIALLPLCTFVAFGILDQVEGTDSSNLDPQTPEPDLFWYRAITLLWAPIQLLTLFGIIAYAVRAPHLSGSELGWLAAGLGIVSGAIGIVYAHELMHQKNRLERWLGDILMTSALYGHFRSEHLLVHHRYVGTPRDAVTARYNENFYAFFLRVIPGSLISAWHAEAALLARKGLSPFSRRNPFWRYAALSLGFLALSGLLGGWAGIGMFVLQAFVAVLLLEVINYVEHYGLTRKHLGDGRYEHVRPHHSWNAEHKVSNWFLINLQRHSDHHYKPDRRFPLLQSYDAGDAPHLPHGYPVMGIVALFPPLWRRRMNPRVQAWRKRFYPEITDWRDYTAGRNPLPR